MTTVVSRGTKPGFRLTPTGLTPVTWRKEGGKKGGGERKRKGWGEEKKEGKES